MNKKIPRVAIIIPAFNESQAIGSVIQDVKKQLNNNPFSYEIIVIDDHSTDNTAATAEDEGAKVIRHILNTGAGGATATGLVYAFEKGFDIAATMDADGQHDPADVLIGIEKVAMGKADLLIGSRLINTRGMSKVKVLGNKGLSQVTRILFGIKVSDSQSGLRIFSSLALSKLKWKKSGYEFCSEMLWRAHQNRIVIDEYPVKAIYTDYSRSKGQNNWNGVNIVKSLVQLRVMELFGE